MAKFSGELGYLVETDLGNGITEPSIIYKKCKGDLLENRRTSQNSNEIIEGVQLSNKFSIIANPFMLENLGKLKVVKYLGVPWEINSAGYNKPRVIIDVKGVYNA